MDISGSLVCPSMILFIEFYIVYTKLPLCVPKTIVHFYYYFSGECSSLNTNIPPSAQKFGQLESRLRSLDLEVSTWAKGICGDHI